MGGDTRGLRPQVESLGEKVKRTLREAGATAVGIAAAGLVGTEITTFYSDWIASGHNAGMEYMARHMQVRPDTRELLEGARSVICMAFPYGGAGLRDVSLPRISSYALFPDYHDTIRQRIRNTSIGEWLGREGEDWRLCVDSAPLFERYWAVRSGIGFRGDNGALIVPGIGSNVFLAEIVTRAVLKPDKANTDECMHCGKCHAACPTGALLANGTIDCNRCLSYLTIEHRGDWVRQDHIMAMSTPAGRNTLFGCDRCISACPYNARELSTDMAEEPLERIVSLTAGEIIDGTADNDQRNPDCRRLSEILRGSSLKRAGRTGLRRNALNTLS